MTLESEIEKFNKLAAEWWNPRGPMAPLHWMNPARLDFIRENLAMHAIKPPAKGIDVGCGAGLLTEPLCRMGFSMTGLDGAADALAAARAHAATENLSVHYREGLSETIAAEGKIYDFVTALEIIEHVDDPAGFVESLSAITKPGGLIFLSTLNKTLKSRMLSIWLAEHILRALPVGTHDYEKFIAPSQLVTWLQNAGCDVLSLKGMVFKPLARQFALSDHDLDTNYILVARKL